MAKIISTLDHISNGHINLGIGAGWYKTENISFGFNWDRLSLRINRLKESILLIKELWTEDNVNFDGIYYKTINANLEPKPVQKPYPPIWIGGKSQAIKQLVTEKGNGWIPVLPSPTELSKDLHEIKTRMENIGRDFNNLDIAYGGAAYTLITNDDELAKRELKKISKDRKILISKLNYMIGNPSFIKEIIQQYKKLGVKHIITGFLDFPSLANLKLFAESIIPSFK